MIEADPSLGEPLVPGLPYLRAEAVYAARYEMAADLDDVLSRRTRAVLLGARGHGRRGRRRGGPGRRRARVGRRPTRPAEAATLRATLAHERAAAGLPESVGLA